MWRKLQWWLRRSELEEDFTEEIRSHLALEGHDGRKSFGNIARIQEETRDAWGWGPLERFLNDMRHGLRMLRRSPGWTLVMTATLALGIGLSTAIFSVVYSVLLQPLPYTQPERLVSIWSTSTNGLSAASTGPARFNADAASWGSVRTEAKSFEDVALVRTTNFNLTGDGEPERLQGARASFNISRVLGVEPMLGRAWTEEEDRRDAPVAVLSYGLWERRFGKAPGILGRKIEMNGTPFEVIGVMPPDYRYPSREFELWAPLFVPQEAIKGRYNDFRSVGRLRADVTLAQAQQEVSAIMDRDPNAVTSDGARLGLYLEPFLETTVGSVKDTLWALLEAVGGLLLIGCLSLGGLLIARSSARAREMSLRAALGAGPGQLRRQVLAEILPLSLAGAVGGVALAWALVRGLRSWLPPTMPRTEVIALHAPVLAFSAGVSVLVVLLAALLPAVLASRTELAAAMKSATRSVTSTGHLRQWLVSAQIAVTLAILFGTGLLVRSLAAQLAVQPGFDSRGVLTLHLAVTRAQYPQDAEVSAYMERILARIKTLPNVAQAGFVNRLPLNGSQINPIEFEDRLSLGVQRVSTRSATPGYFAAMGIPLLRGRSFAETDQPKTLPVGIIDDLMARRLYPNENPIGKRFRFSLGNFHTAWAEVVGVVGHVHNEGPEQDNRPQVYWPLSQRMQDRGALVVRTSGPPEALTAGVIARIRAENRDQAVYDVRTMQGWMDRILQTRTLLTGLIASFAGASLLLACLGLYGVVAYNAGLRLREFGVRMALGARAGDIRVIVLGHAGRVVAIGALVGLLAAWPVGRAIQSLLFEVPPLDVLSLAIAAAVLLGVALIAALGPAVRAANANPAITLRAD